MSIFSMNQPASFYFEAGKKHIETGDFYNGLLYLKKAAYLEPSEGHLIELAMSYTRIGYQSTENLPIFFKLFNMTNKPQYKKMIAKEIKNFYFSLLKDDEAVAQILYYENESFDTCDDIIEVIVPRKLKARNSFYHSTWNYTLSELLDFLRTLPRNAEKKDVDYVANADDAMLNNNPDLAVSLCFEVEEEALLYDVSRRILMHIAIVQNSCDLILYCINELLKRGSVYGLIYLIQLYNEGTIDIDNSLACYNASSKGSAKDLFSFDKARKTLNEREIINNLLLREIKGLFTKERAEDLTLLSLGLVESNDLKNAEIAAKHAFMIAPFTHYIRCNYIKILVLNNNVKAASEICKKYLEIFPNDSFLIVFNWLFEEEFFPNKHALLSKEFWGFVTKKLLLSYKMEFINNCQRKSGKIFLSRRAYEIMNVIFATKAYELMVEIFLINRVIEEDLYQDYLLRLLEQVEIDDHSKLAVFYALLFSEKEVDVVANTIIRSRLQITRIKNCKFKGENNSSYRQHIFAAASCHFYFYNININFKLLKEIVSKMLDNSGNFRSSGSFVAVTVYLYMSAVKRENFFTIKDLSIIFNTTVPTIKKYLEHYKNIF